MKRFARIYVVLLPALALTLIVDVLGQHLFPPVYAGAVDLAAVNFAAADRFDGAHAAVNILNLQSFVLAPFGSNGPLWSLSYEWWFYVCFGLLMMRSWLGIFIGFALCAALAVLQGQFPFYFALWFAGAAVRAVAGACTVKPVSGLLYCGAALLATGTFLGLRLIDVPGIDPAAAVGLTFAAFLGVHHLAQRGATWQLPFRARQLNVLLAESSYTLYAIHLPLIVLVSAVVSSIGLNPFRQPPSVGLWAAGFVMVLCLYLASFAFYAAFERRVKEITDLLLQVSDRMRG